MTCFPPETKCQIPNLPKVNQMKDPHISKNHLLHNIDSCKSLSSLYQIVRDYGINVRMQALSSASNVPAKKKFSPTDISADNTYLERLKRSVMQAVEEQFPN